MFFYFSFLLKGLMMFSGSYSNTVFPPPLSKKEEEECIDKMMAGDKNARDKLIEHNLRFVAHIVNIFVKNDSETDDLISIGTIGLIKGIDSFSKNKHTKITTYVARCIENEILMYFRSNKKFGNDISLNDYIGLDKDGNEISLLDITADDDEDLSVVLHKNMNKQLLLDYINILTKREREIIIKRYGLYGSEEYTQKDIAKMMKISRSYVSRIEKRALSKLFKQFLKDKHEL